MSDILVYVEHDADGITDLSLQCLSHGKKTSAASGMSLSAVVLGQGISDVVSQVQGMGINVLAADDEQLANYLPLPYAKIMVGIAQENSSKVCTLPSSTVGNDLAPMLAAKLDAACVLGVTEVACDGKPQLKRLEFDAKAKTIFEPTTGTTVVTLADGIEEGGPEADGSGEVSNVAVALDASELKSRVDRREVVRKTVNLKDAKVIVGGGAGVGSAENFNLLRQLADKLGGEVGATRAAVDAGWVSAERQIGQTGVNVRPDLYIACGISGAVQHIVGIREAKKIIAINIDATAPIFKMAHYKIVGDLSEVIPKLIELI